MYREQLPIVLIESGDAPMRPHPDPEDSGGQGFQIAEDAEAAVDRLLQIKGMHAFHEAAVFSGVPRGDASAAFEDAERVLADQGLELTLMEGEAGQVVAHIGRPAPERVSRSGWISAALLVATLLTTTWAGAAHQGQNPLAGPAGWWAGVPYALALLAVLGVHEMGHYLVARRRGVGVSLPYFIPAPGFLGTFGAFIRMPGRVRSRADYFDIAVAGPLAGLGAAVLAIWVGMMTWTTPASHGMDPRSSTLFYLIYRLCGGSAQAALVDLGPIGFAGWLGLVVTALNLVPIGQLDGGHLAYAVFGRRRAALLGSAVLGLLVAGGLFYTPHLLVWALIAWMLAGGGHPPASNELAPVGPGRRLIAVLAVILLLAILLPWPG